MPLELTLVTLVAACLAGQLNRGIDRLAWNPRARSPWGPTPPQAAPRTWLDRLPVLGWWRLRRETALHGRGFWVRPALIESTSLGAAYLAGLESGVWKDGEELSRLRTIDREFVPSMDAQTRRALLDGWAKAVRQARTR